MELSLLLAQKIAVLFLIMFFGFAVVRLKLIKAGDSRILSLMLLYVVIPCLIINSFQIECTPERLRDFLVLTAACTIAHLVFIPLAMALRKPLKLRPVEQAAVIYPNCGNLTLPLVASVFGEEMVFFATPYVLFQTIMIWTHGRAIICSGSGRTDWKKILLNINLICCVVGVLLFVTGIRLPGMLAEACSSLGGIIGPTSMLLTGMLIGGADLKKVFSQGHTYLVCFLRLLVCPILLIIVLKIINFPALASDPAILMITLLGASGPSATTVTNLAQVNNSDPEIAATVNIVSMLFCIVTMPLINFIYQLVLM